MKGLMIDGDRGSSNNLKIILESKGYTIECIYDFLGAKRINDFGKFDLLIIDIDLPKKDGIGIIRAFRTVNNRCPIIVLSAIVDVKTKVEALDSGADDYITKPYDTEELLARIGVLVRRYSYKNEPVITFGNLILDKTNGVIYTEFGTEKLINKEVQILELLMNNKGTITSTDAIINNVWPPDSYTIDSNLWVFLSYLRKKLKKIKSNVVIKNYRNIGYRLEIL